MNPTDEQIKEFWSKCGLCIHEWDEEEYGMIGDTVCKKCGKSNIEYLDDTGKIWAEIPANEYPIDLNNLFKYAVPKLEDVEEISFIKLKGEYDCELTNGGQDGWGTLEIFARGEDKDPALALFWAIFKVLKESDE